MVLRKSAAAIISSFHLFQTPESNNNNDNAINTLPPRLQRLPTYYLYIVSCERRVGSTYTCMCICMFVPQCVCLPLLVRTDT